MELVESELELEETNQRLDEETDALYTRIFKKGTQNHDDGNNNSYIALNNQRANSNDKIYKNSKTGESFTTAVCNYYKKNYPKNYEQYKAIIRQAAIDRFNRH